MSRRRKKTTQLARPTPIVDGSIALAERQPQNIIPIEEAYLLEAGRGKRGGSAVSKAFSLAWDETEAMGITADMRRSGPGMLSDQDRKDTLYQAYLNSVWISACVDVIAKRITSGGMVIELTEKGTENQTEYDALHEFLHYINEDEDFLQLIRSIATDILIYGEAYMEIVRKGGKPYSLHKIDCSTMNYKLDKHGNVIQYIQNMSHSTETVTFEPDEVIRWWLPDPKANKKALSPIERILGSVDADAHMADWARSFFRKGARPNFWIKYAGKKEDASRFVVWLRENYTGQANAHVPLVLYDEAELHEIGKGAVDMDFTKGRGMMRQEILAGYQVPPAIVAQIESGNIGGGTGESQDKSFQFNACDPIRSLIFEKFNYRLIGGSKGFGIKNYQVNTRYADFRSDDSVATIQDKRIRNGSNTVNEVRAEMGKNPVDGGDEAVIVASRDIVPVARLEQLTDEQAQQSQTAIQQAQAQLEMTKVQVDKAKNPPPPPTIVQQPPPSIQAPEKPQNAPEKGNKDTQEQYTRDLQQGISAIRETLARADEHLRVIRAEDVTPTQYADIPPEERQYLMSIGGADGERAIRKRQRDNEGKDDESNTQQQQAPTRDQSNDEGAERPNQERTTISRDDCTVNTTSENTTEQNTKEQHTGIMVAFLLNPETANQLAIPGGEDPSIMHVTLAYMGEMEDEPEQGKLHPVQSLDTLRFVLSSFAANASPLEGNIGGLARFAPSPSSDGKTPVIALVNVQGLQDWRRELVTTLEDAGYFVANNFDYTPHITLDYIDADQPMPIETVPALPLVFHGFILAIGDEYTHFPLGENNVTWSQENTEVIPQSDENGSREQSELSQYATGSTEDDPTNDSGSGVDEQLSAELARWQERAIEDVEQSRAWRGFTTTIIPESLHMTISQALEHCTSVDEVNATFDLEESTEQNKLAKQIQSVFDEVVQRGHKELEAEHD